MVQDNKTPVAPQPACGAYHDHTFEHIMRGMEVDVLSFFPLIDISTGFII